MSAAPVRPITDCATCRDLAVAGTDWADCRRQHAAGHGAEDGPTAQDGERIMRRPCCGQPDTCERACPPRDDAELRECYDAIPPLRHRPWCAKLLAWDVPGSCDCDHGDAEAEA